MSAALRASGALAAVLAALVGDWVASELFLTRAPAAHVVAVLALHALALAGLGLMVRRVVGTDAMTRLLRTAALFGAIGLLAISLRSAMHPVIALGITARIALVAVVAVGAYVLVRRLDEALNERLVVAVTLASIAFLIAPVAVKKVAPAPREWIAAAPTGAPRATLFLLLDEFAHSASAPLADDLRRAGLYVTHDALVPAGKDTQNVVPAMFTGHDFSNVRVCGISAMCSNLAVLDFSAIRVARSDVHVVGQHFPYCDIPHLKSCFQVARPFSLASIARGFSEHFLKRLGLRPPAFLAPIVEPADQQRRLLEAHTAFIDRSAFWRGGGVLYAHLFMPHPPGLDGMKTLDGDYAANLQVARALVASYVARLRSGFGSRFSIVITSDHPLRTYWCEDEWYGAERCAIRPEFRDDKVPLIVASDEPLQPVAIRSNQDVFSVLNREAARP